MGVSLGWFQGWLKEANCWAPLFGRGWIREPEGERWAAVWVSKRDEGVVPFQLHPLL